MNNWKEERMLLVWVDDYGYWLACGVPNNLYKRRFQRAKIGMCGAKEMKEEEEVARDIVFEQTVQIYQNDYLLAESCQGYFNHGWNAAIAYAKREQQWIPVSERWPKESGRFLITNSEGVAFALFDGKSFSRFTLAWSEIPEPYQPKTDGVDLTIRTLGKMTPTEIAALDWADVRRVLSGETDGDKAEGE